MDDVRADALSPETRDRARAVVLDIFKDHYSGHLEWIDDETCSALDSAPALGDLNALIESA